MNTHHETATPTLSVLDPRALAIRGVAYYQHPEKPGVESRITRQSFDEAGRQVASWDPRLYGAAPKPNMAAVYALSGQGLFTDGVDAGWQACLLNEAGSLCAVWDARGNQSHHQYDELQRPIALTEQAHDGPSRVVERWIYGEATDDAALRNQCGQVIRHDDPAGNRHFDDYGLGGSALVESRRFLIELETPDWPLFKRMGMNLNRRVIGDRTLAYLSLDSTLRSKVAGAETGFRLNTAPGQDIKAQAAIQDAGVVAYVNGGFYNMGNQASRYVSPFAPIGPSKIGGKSQIYVPVPSDYRKHFVTDPSPTSLLIRKSLRSRTFSENGSPEWRRPSDSFHAALGSRSVLVLAHFPWPTLRDLLTAYSARAPACLHPTESPPPPPPARQSPST